MHCAINLDTYARNDLDECRSGPRSRARPRRGRRALRARSGTDRRMGRARSRARRDQRARTCRIFTYADFARRRPAACRRRAVVRRRRTSITGSPASISTRATARGSRSSSRTTISSAGRARGAARARARGHAIEAHSVKHLRAPLYVEQHGLAAYLRRRSRCHRSTLLQRGRLRRHERSRIPMARAPTRSISAVLAHVHSCVRSRSRGPARPIRAPSDRSYISGCI